MCDTSHKLETATPRSSFFYLLCICFLQFHADFVQYAKNICICQKKVVPLHAKFACEPKFHAR